MVSVVVARGGSSTVRIIRHTHTSPSKSLIFRPSAAKRVATWSTRSVNQCILDSSTLSRIVFPSRAFNVFRCSETCHELQCGTHVIDTTPPLPGPPPVDFFSKFPTQAQRMSFTPEEPDDSRHWTRDGDSGGTGVDGEISYSPGGTDTGSASPSRPISWSGNSRSRASWVKERWRSVRQPHYHSLYIFTLL